jgi:cysteine desulfurase
MRSGTLDVPSIVGLGEACRLRQLEMEDDEKAIASKRDRLQSLLLDKIPGLVINGDTTSRLQAISTFQSPIFLTVQSLLEYALKLAISTGSACSSGVETPSHVLRALGLPDNVIEGALRIGLGKFTTQEDIDQAADILSDAVSQVRQAMLV